MRFVIARELLSLWAVTRAALCLSVFFALLPSAFTLAAERGIQLDGPRVQGGLVRGRVAPGSAVQFEGEPLRVSKDGWFLIGSAGTRCRKPCCRWCFRTAGASATASR